jgi:putative copper export protein
MVDVGHLVARFVHVGSAMLWVGYLGALAWVAVPAIREAGEQARVAALLDKLAWTRALGPVVFLAGFWLVTASGRSFGQLVEPGWGHAILGGIALATAMIGLEHGRVFPKLREAGQAQAGQVDAPLEAAGRAAGIACALGLVTAFLMVVALLGGF